MLDEVERIARFEFEGLQKDYGDSAFNPPTILLDRQSASVRAERA